MEIKDAVRNAIAFAAQTLGPERTAKVRLEEVESAVVDGTPVWQITLSNAMIPSGGANSIHAMAVALGAEADREYKVFTVSKNTGEVFSMKIRLLAVPAM